jgi:hypothetical protein
MTTDATLPASGEDRNESSFRARRYRLVVLALAAGLGARVWLGELSPRYGYLGDHDDYVRWGIQAADAGLTAFYTGPPPRAKNVVYRDDGTTTTRTRTVDRVLNYPPVSAYLLWLQGEAYKAVGQERLVNTRTSRRLYALLPVLCDIIVAFGCLAIVRDLAPRWAPLAFAAAFLAPPLAIDGALWGQTDSWLLAPTVWMVWAMMRGRWTLAGLLWGVALGVKPQGVLFVPVWGLALLLADRRRSVLLGALTAVAVLNVAAAPFWFTSEANWFRESFMRNIVHDYTHTTLKAFNVWYIDLLRTEELSASASLLGLTKDAWGRLLTVVAMVVAFAIVRRRRHATPVALCLFSGLVLLVCVMLPTRVHERYVVLCLPFLICAACRNRRLWPGLVVLLVVASFQLTWYLWSTRLAGSASERQLRAYYSAEAARLKLPAPSRQRHIDQQTERELRNRAKDRPVEWALTIAALASFVSILLATALPAADWDGKMKASGAG